MIIFNNLEIKGNNLIRHLLKATRFIALLPAITLPLNVYAARNYEGNWFEIEVILFSQIDDKSQLQEVFPDTSVLPKPKSIIDIFDDYLDPNIAALKSRIAVCSEFSNDKTDILSTSFDLHYPSFEEQIAEDETNNFYLFNNSEIELQLNTQLVLDSFFNEEQNLEESNDAINTFTDSSNESIALAADDDPFAEYDKLLAEQETTAQPNTAPYEDEFEHIYSFNTPEIPQQFCVVPEAFFDDYKLSHPEFSYNGVPLDNVPSIISGEEDLTTEKPYFISEESLQLQDIFKQLRSSRNFKPLLHLGWRQKTFGPEDAIPLKLYAGENLMQPYYQALSKYNQAQENKLALAQNNQIFEEQGYNPFNSEQPRLSIEEATAMRQQAAMQEQINSILQKSRTIKPTIESVLTALDNNPNDLVNPVSNSFITGEEVTPSQRLIEPQKPPQTWTIEGFLKVEVEHYLHITADFNVINMSLAEQATKQLISKEPVKLKSIRFEQNKRVRSTEIHYFDHPYMGMIVQIRRHEQVPPEENFTAEEQLINEMD